MLTLDGAEHRRHRAPFAARSGSTRCASASPPLVAEETERLIDAFEPAGQAELRRSFAGPLAAAVVMHALGLRARARRSCSAGTTGSSRRSTS